MKKRFLYVALTLIVVFLVGCSTTTSRTTVYKENGKEYAIYGICSKKYNYGVQIFVNNQVVIDDTHNGFTPVVNFSGKYNNIKVEAECTPKDTGALMMAYFCGVYMNGNKAADLTF